MVFVDGLFAPHLSDLAACPAAAADAADADGAGSFVGVFSDLAARAEQSPGLAAALAGAAGALDFLPEISYETDRRTRQGSAALAALNQACASDAAVIYAGAGETCPPTQVLFFDSGARAAAHPRLVVLAAAGASVDLVQSYAGRGGGIVSVDGGGGGGGGGGVANGLTRVVVGEGAVVAHAYVQEASAGAVHLDAMSVGLEGRAAAHRLTAFMTGGSVARLNYDSIILGERANKK